MGLILEELIELVYDPSEQECSIYDASAAYDVVYKGKLENVPRQYHKDEVVGIDNIEDDCVLGINIDHRQAVMI